VNSEFVVSIHPLHPHPVACCDVCLLQTGGIPAHGPATELQTRDNPPLAIMTNATSPLQSFSGLGSTHSDPEVKKSHGVTFGDVRSNGHEALDLAENVSVQPFFAPIPLIVRARLRSRSAT